MFSHMKNYVQKVFSHEQSLNISENKSGVDSSNYGKLTSPLTYHRPLFLNLSEGEEKLAGDHKTRSVVIPKDSSVLPFDSGYCEVINGGKSTLNEDCSVAFSVVLETLSKTNPVTICESLKGLLDPDSDNFYKTANQAAKTDVSSIPSKESNATNSNLSETDAEDFEMQSANQVSSSAVLKIDASSECGDAAPSTNVEAKDFHLKVQPVEPGSKLTCPSIEELNLSSMPGDEKMSSASCINSECDEQSLRLDYFAIFDGHAGEGAALYAADVLHEVLIERLKEVQHILLVEDNSNPVLPDRLFEMNSASSQFVTATPFYADSLIIGLLQDVLLETDRLFKVDADRFKLSGGCTALLVIFILGKMYVASAGDCRAVLCRSENSDVNKTSQSESKVVALPMSQDFTPGTERRRLQYLAYLQPNLLGDNFTRLEFVRRVSAMDIGKKVLYRDYHMTGWAYKEVTSADTRFPMISGTGKSRRLLGTIAVTRGLGDHTLHALNQHLNVPVKPFMSPVPEVRVYDLTSRDHGANDVLIMGSDGFWDILNCDEAAQQVISCLEKLDESDPQRYCVAAKELVLAARGNLINGMWRTNTNKPASVDDISVFVIPLLEASKKQC